MPHNITGVSRASHSHSYRNWTRRTEQRLLRDFLVRSASAYACGCSNIILACNKNMLVKSGKHETT